MVGHNGVCADTFPEVLLVQRNLVSADQLKLYADPTARQGNELKVIGMPTSILIDAQGREIGRLIGPAEWDSPDAKRLIESVL